MPGAGQISDGGDAHSVFSINQTKQKTGAEKRA
jgi:hypothetical protein